MASKHAARRGTVRRAERGATIPDAPPASRNPRFEALALWVAAAPAQDASRAAARVAAEAGLGAWRIEAVHAGSGEFELVPAAGRSRISVRAAWNATYRLREEPDVIHAEPLFRYEVPELHRRAPSPQRASAAREEDDPATDGRFEWSLERANVPAAWTAFGARPPGGGVTVGHPDTGYTPHPELADPARLLIRQGYDFEADDPNPLDELDTGLLATPGHGTSTASVIVSGRGVAGTGGAGFVSGVAPGAALIPIRVTSSPVLLSTRGLRQAVDHAVAQGADVISMSLGGPLPSAALRSAIRRATDAGVIVLAAAGNQVRVVVYPAAFDEVIAVAASTSADVPWPGSCRGAAVDITAPGASVWRAQVERASGDGFAYSVTRGSGTSFAVATTAGVAALWLSLHGAASLRARYGAAHLARVFKAALQRSCRTPRGWDGASFGPGIVDAAALLREPLPRQPVASKLRDPRRAAVAADPSGLEAILHLLPDAPRTGAERALAELLGAPERELPSVLADVGDELVFQLVMHPPLRATVEARAKQLGASPRVRRATPASKRLERGALAGLCGFSGRLARRIRGASR